MTNSRWSLLASGLACTLAGAAFVASLRVGSASRDSAGAMEPSVGAHESALDSRLRALEQRVATAPGAANARSERAESSAGPDSNALESRMTNLEQRVSRIERALALPEHPPAEASAEQFHKALHALGVSHPGETNAAAVRLERIALRERFLAAFPQDSKSKVEFTYLISDYLFAERPEEALAAITRHARALGLEDWQAELARAEVASSKRQLTNYRAALQRATDDAQIPMGERAQAEFFIAHSFLEEGRAADSRAAFESFISRYQASDKPEVLQLIEGAKLQMNKLKSTGK